MSIALGEFTCLALGYLIATMDIDDIRRANIRALELSVGSPTQAAKIAGMSGSQYTNLRDGAHDPRSGKKRGMRKETAWRFEDAFGKPRGWLDSPHPDYSTPPGNTAQEPLPDAYGAAANVFQFPSGSPLLRELAAHAEKLNDRGLILLIEQAEQLVQRYSKAQANHSNC